MKTTQKVKVQTTTAKVAILYNDNSSEIKDILVIGKYNMSKAKKYFKEEWTCANLVNVEVLSVTHTIAEYIVDTVALNNWCNENKLDEEVTQDTEE